MKKTLSILGLIGFGSLFSQNIPFDKLYSNGDPVNFYLGHYPVTGSDGLDINWYGGVRLRTSTGVGFQLLENGNVGIGTATPAAKLDVNGGARFFDFVSAGSNSWIWHTPDGDGRKTLYMAPMNAANTDWDWSKAFIINGENGNALLNGKFEAKEVKVTSGPTADFVFEEDYKLPKLDDVETHIKEKKHLPEIASAKEMEKEGVNIGEFQIKLLQKIEELTLYTIEQNKQIKRLQEQNETLKSQSEDIKELKKQVLKMLSDNNNKKSR
ncbi:hypothetical protein [Chryseobacterium rhizosphaerae]|uniref:hypothetical protein n=1 Tax=Chryseobacterium rhizosphaerae TaxID=395937 RepID=UPI00235860AE|nr:hypothetical protein [Chryseobacterium rhizosphaerae]MDC8101880.1 hypothetical protein [Chryseobacterium rhizosphaerae]